MTQPKTILVVDDEPHIRKILRFLLEQNGFRVLTAVDGVDGLAQARAGSPDLILLDLLMPRLGGLEVCRRLRADSQTRLIPIIIVTARNETSDRVRGLDAGANDFVAKPYDHTELLARVRAAMGWAAIQRHAAHRLVPAPSAEDVKQEIASGEGPALEFKATLRRNLRTNQPDAAMTFETVRAIAGFSNGEGGVLLIGVEDTGKVLGIDVDGFENHDKFLLHLGSVVRQYLGQGVATSIAAQLVEIDGLVVCHIRCPRSNVPVFVTDRTRQDFFLRTGPSTVRLALSDFYVYALERFKER